MKFLNGKDIFSLFNLTRVVYVEYNNQTNLMAWVCEKHNKEGLSNHTMEVPPI
jgi:hypothetical protein